MDEHKSLIKKLQIDAEKVEPHPMPPGYTKPPRFRYSHVPPQFPAPRIYRVAGTALGASMWFFLMYRAKQDGPALMGWKHPWDH